MTPIRKLYLTTFLETGVPYGLIMILFDLLSGEGFSIWKLLFLTIFFGLFMSLFLVGRVKRKFKKLGVVDISSENLQSIQHRTMTSSKSPESLLNSVMENTDFKNIKFTLNGEEKDLKMGLSWWTWGERINVNSKAVSDTDFEYEITSMPRTKNLRLDYGKNYENVTKVQQLLKS